MRGGWTEEKRQAFEKMWNEGVAIPAICARLGLSETAAQKARHRFALAVRAPRCGWGEEITERMIAMKAAGYSASAIALALGNGITRNAIIGKLARLGLGGGPGQRRPRVNNHPPAPRSAAPPRKVVTAPLTERRAAAERDLPATDDPFAPTGCRWPMGDPLEKGFRLCQRTKLAGSVYCDVHHEAAYEPRPKARRAVPGPASAWT